MRAPPNLLPHGLLHGSFRTARPRFACLAGALLLAGCGLPPPGLLQSALEPAGRAAETIAALFYWMAAVAVVVWLVVIGLGLYAMRTPPGAYGRGAATMIIGGGVILPTVLLTALLAYGLSLLPELLAPAPPGSLRITVRGEQWWWRVRYEPPGGAAFELANEIRLPVDEPVELRLESADVIHSFWIPSLGGKIDMFPRRTTHLTLHPTRTGLFRGACTEYCGTAHALMSFDAVVQSADEFASWVRGQAAPAAAPAEALAAQGAELFLANGCGACHRIRGTQAQGEIGPDLTHVGSRTSLGAGILPNDPAGFRRWIAHTADVKPGVHMPAFGMLAAGELRALAAYLDSLQ